MIIDLRTRLEAFLADDPVEAESPFECVDGAVVVTHVSERLNRRGDIQRLVHVVRSQPGRLVGFAGIDPTLPDALDQVDRVVDAGLSGVSVAPADQACRATSDLCLALLERCAARGLPVLVANPCLTCRGSVLEYADPIHLDEAMRTIPELKIVLGDLGFGWLDNALLMLAKHERAFAEISTLIERPWSLYNALQCAQERGVLDRLLFASGMPGVAPARAIERVYTINSVRQGAGAPPIPRESLRRIIERDSLALLGVEHMVGKRLRPETGAST
jgi:predicted TIM-barrel fold metal-dependent hydrolase